MKTFKRIIRILGLVLLIILASFGIGLAGGVPLEITHKRETQEHDVEWVMTEEESEPGSDQIKNIH